MNATAVKITYAEKTCGRCGGSGHYSYNSISGTVCFGCRGRKTVLTPVAAKAAKAIEAFKVAHFSVAVEALVPGDRIKVDGVTRTVVSVVRSEKADSGSKTGDGPWIYRHTYTLTFNQPVPSAFGKFSVLNTTEGATYVRAITGADWDTLVAFAATLKGVTLVQAVR